MKRDRQAVIKQMIAADKISTQEEIKQRLEEAGISVTQATLSRDLREIGLLKLRDEEGRLYYSLSEAVMTTLDPAVFDYVKKVARAQFMLILHTDLGEADVLANLIDHDDNPEILGTIAGADTLLVICKDEQVAAKLESELG
ncbi:arginine repressor [Streptococcus dentiloxodontae]